MKRPIESDYTSIVGYTRALEEYCEALAQPEQEPCLSPCGDIKCAVICKRHTEHPEQNADRFCDANCVWTDHHPDCKLAQLEQRGPTKQEHNILMGALKRSGKVLATEAKGYKEAYFALLETIAKNEALLPRQTILTMPQNKPLTHEQRFDLLTKFEAHKHEWHALAILIDMVEAAHGIKEQS